MEGVAIRTLLTSSETSLHEFSDQMRCYQSYSEDRKILFTDVENSGEMKVSSCNRYLLIIYKADLELPTSLLGVYDINTKEKVIDLPYEGIIKSFSEQNGSLLIGGSVGLQL